MTPDLSDFRTWIHAPEGWIIIGLTTFFTCTTLFEIVIFPRILPVERVEQQVLANTQATNVEVRGIKYFCDVNRLSLIGFKFSATSLPKYMQWTALLAGTSARAIGI